MISGIIYAIIDDGYFYIGSTTKTLEIRLIRHVSCSKNKSFKMKLYKYINEQRNSNWDNILIIPLETIECETNKELRDKEYEYINRHINDPLSLNDVRNDKQMFSIITHYTKKH